MKYNFIGQSNIKVSALALGCMSFTGDANWGVQEEKDSIGAIKSAIDIGINFFDTAEGYGNGMTEEILSKALGKERNKVVIGSKVSPNHLNREALFKACEDSLKRLGTDYIDLYQIHWPNDHVDIDETMQALISLKQQGKIREIGISNFGSSDMEKVMGYNAVVTNQMPYSLLMRGIEYEIVPKCIKNNVGILSYSSLAQGLLTGKYKNADEFPQRRARTRLFSTAREFTNHGESGCEKEVFEALQKIKDIADKLGCEMSEVSLAWLLHQNGVTSVVAGGRTAEQVINNAKGVDLVLDKDIITDLNKATQAVKEYIGANPDPWSNRIK